MPCSCVARRGPSVYCYRPCVAVATFSIIFHLCHCLPFLPYIPTYSSIYHYFQFLPIPPTFCLVLCTIVSRFVRCAVTYSLPSLRSCIHSACVLVCCLSPAPSAWIPARCRGGATVWPLCRVRCLHTGLFLAPIMYPLLYIHSFPNISEYIISMAFFSTCALLVPAFSAILCSFSAYPLGRLACILSVFSALYRAIARRWAALVLLSCSCIIIHHDTIIYPWLYIHGYLSTLHRYFLSFFKLRFLCMVYPWIVWYNIATTTEQPTAPRPRPHVVTP